MNGLQSASVSLSSVLSAESPAPILKQHMIHRHTTTQPHLASRGAFLDRNDILFLTALLICSLTFSLTLYLRGDPITPPGPSFAIASSTKAIWENGSLTSHHAQAVFDAAQALSKSMQSDVWQDVFAQDARGNLVPKHSVISSFIAAPFYGLFGEIGFWVCQQFFFFVLSYCFYRCVTTLSGASAPLTSLLALGLLSPAIAASYTFVYDLHGLTFIVAGLLLSRTHPFLGGLVLGCSVFVRPSNLLVIVPLLFAWTDPKHLGGVIKGGLGVLCALGALCLYNVLLWGDPFTTAYSYLPLFSRGDVVIQRHPLGFDHHEFTRDWQGKLFGPEGLFSRYGTLATIPCAIWMALRSSRRIFYGSCLIAAALNTAYVFSYSMWDPGVSPHRFFLPSIVLCLIPFTVFVGRIETWLRNRSASLPHVDGVIRR